MAERNFRKKEDLYIKPKEQRRTKSFFITSSAKMSNDKITKTTISSSHFAEMSQSFAKGEYLIDDYSRTQQGAILYMLQEMQADIDDVYNEVSASAFQSSYFPFATIDSSSFGVISSSLVPDKDEKYNLGSSGKEWHTSYMLTASIGGGIFTSASLAAGGGGGTADFSSVGEHIIPDGDNTRDLGSSTKEFRNLYIDGTAYIDSIAGGTISANMVLKNALILPSVTQLSSISNGLLDMRNYSVAEIKQKSGAWSITSARAASEFQEITIIGLTAGVIKHSSKGSPFTFMFANGSNLAVSAGQAYKFISDANGIWRQIH